MLKKRRFMRRKPSPKIPPQKRWVDIHTDLSYEDTSVRFYNSGMITFKGSIKHAAIAFARYILDTVNLTRGGINYLCIRVYPEDKKSTIEWLGKGIIEDDVYPEPKFWEEFKKEFERYCELKAFL